MIADANYGLPLATSSTTASRNDSPELPAVFAKTESLYPGSIHPSLSRIAATTRRPTTSSCAARMRCPIIHIRRKPGPGGTLYDGIYTEKGVPTCLGQIPMEYVRSDPDRGHLYRCNTKGCRLAVSIEGRDPPLRHGGMGGPHQKRQAVRGHQAGWGQEWKALYAKRQAIERVFKSMKESRRLERHCVRGLRQITLHAMMSALAFPANALVKLRTGQADMMRWMVRKVA